jgi:hypothetical protein
MTPSRITLPEPATDEAAGDERGSCDMRTADKDRANRSKHDKEYARRLKAQEKAAKRAAKKSVKA